MKINAGEGGGINKSTSSSGQIVASDIWPLSFSSPLFLLGRLCWPLFLCPFSQSSSFPWFMAPSLSDTVFSCFLPSVSLRLRPTASKKGPQCKCDSFTSQPFVDRRLSPALLVCFDPRNCGCDYCMLLFDTGRRKRRKMRWKEDKRNAIVEHTQWRPTSFVSLKAIITLLFVFGWSYGSLSRLIKR